MSKRYFKFLYFISYHHLTKICTWFLLHSVSIECPPCQFEKKSWLIPAGWLSGPVLLCNWWHASIIDSVMFMFRALSKSCTTFNTCSFLVTGIPCTSTMLSLEYLLFQIINTWFNSSTLSIYDTQYSGITQTTHFLLTFPLVFVGLIWVKFVKTNKK